MERYFGDVVIFVPITNIYLSTIVVVEQQQFDFGVLACGVGDR